MKTPSTKNLTKTAEPIEFADAQHAAHNLELFADNTRELYDRKKAVIRSLLGKIKKGVYDAELAKKLWRGWIDAAALMYEKELGEKGDARRVFTDAIRKAVVDEFERSEKYAMDQGDWDYLVDKKASTRQAGGLGLSESAIATHLDVMQDMLAKGDAQGLKKRLDQLAADIKRIAQASTKYANELRNSEGKNFMLRFLPYLETPDGQKVETIIGYPNPSRGYGYGRWEEFFSTVHEARDRMRFLVDAGVVEDIELQQLVPGQGRTFRTIDSWDEKRGKEASTKQAVRSATDTVSTDGYHYVLEAGGDVDDSEAWETEMGEATGKYRGDVFIDDARCILFVNEDDNTHYAVLPQNATINGKEASTKLAATDLRSLAIELYKSVVGKAGTEVAQLIKDAIKKAYELGAAEKAARVAALLKTAGPDADDLVLYIDNTEKLYNQKKSIVKNVMRRLRNGTYDAAKAVKLWSYLVEAGAKMWVSELGDEDGDRSVKWNVLFPTAVREQAARDMSETAKQEIDDGDWDFLNEKGASTKIAEDLYHLVVTQTTSGKKSLATSNPATKRECEIMLSKFSPQSQKAISIVPAAEAEAMVSGEESDNGIHTVVLDPSKSAVAAATKTALSRQEAYQLMTSPLKEKSFLIVGTGAYGNDDFDNVGYDLRAGDVPLDALVKYMRQPGHGGMPDLKPEDLTPGSFVESQTKTLTKVMVGYAIGDGRQIDVELRLKKVDPKVAAGAALPDPSELGAGRLVDLVRSIQVVALGASKSQDPIGTIRQLLTGAGLGAVVEAATSKQAVNRLVQVKKLTPVLKKFVPGGDTQEQPKEVQEKLKELQQAGLIVWTKENWQGEGPGWGLTADGREYWASAAGSLATASAPRVAASWKALDDKLGKRWILDAKASDVFDAFHVKETKGPGIPLYSLQAIMKDGTTLRYRALKDLKEAQKVAETYLKSANEGASLLLTDGWTRT